jgi:hypothetical protein
MLFDMNRGIAASSGSSIGRWVGHGVLKALRLAEHGKHRVSD